MQHGAGGAPELAANDTRWFPLLTAEQFGGDLAEMHRFWIQRYARMGLEKFRAHGRGVVVLHLNRTARTLTGEYNVCKTDDGSPEARAILALLSTYDPARQVVMLLRDPERGRDEFGIVNIDPQH